MTSTVATLRAIFTADTSSFMSGARNVRREMDQTNNVVTQRLGGMGRSMTSLGMKLAIPAAAINAIGGASLLAAINFESAFAGVIKTVDGTDEQLGALRETIRQMATDATNPLAGMENAHETIAKIMELGGQLGVPLESLEGFAQTIGSLTLATDLTAESASLMLSQFAAITGMDFDNMDELGSVIVALGNNMATTESNIVEFAQRLAGVGSTIGLSETEILALGGAMASVGLNAEAGGTAMTQVFNEMISAVAGGGGELQSFARTAGVSGQEFADLWNANPMDALTTFLGGLGDLDEAAQVQALEDLGLDGIRVADTLRRLSGDTTILTDALDLANTAWDENTALNEEAQKRLKTTAAQFNVFKNTVKDVAISIGGILLPMFNSLLAVVQPIFKQFRIWVDNHPGVIRAIGRLGAILGVAAGAFIGLGSALTFVAGLLNPITIAVAAMAIAWQTNFMGIRDALEPVVNALKLTFSWVKWFVGGILEALGSGGIAGAVDFFKENIGKLGDGLKNIWSNVNFGQIAQTLLDGLRTVGNTIVSTIGNIWSWFWGTDDQTVSLGNGLVALIEGESGFKDVIIAKVKEVLRSAGDALGAELGNIWLWFWGTDDQVVSMGSGLVALIEGESGFKDMVAGKIKEKLTEIGTALGNLWSWIWGTDDQVASMGSGLVALIEGDAGFRGMVADAIRNALSSVGSAIGNIWDLIFGNQETVSLGSGMVATVGDAGALNFLLNNFIQPLIDNAKAAIESVNWETVGADVVNAIGGAIISGVNFVAWIIESIFSPMTESSDDAAGGHDWSSVPMAIFDAIKTAIGAWIDFTQWVGDVVIGPFIQGAVGAILDAEWSVVPNVLFGILKGAIKAAWNVLEWVWETLVSPLLSGLVTKITDTDWGAFGTALLTGLANGIGDIGQWAYDNIVRPIIDAVSSINISVSTSDVLGVDVPTGISISTGGGGGNVSGVFDAALAAGDRIRGRAMGGPVMAGMPYVVGERGPELFVPSSSGAIMPNMSRGGAGGPTIVIHQVDVHGVEDMEGLFDQLKRVQKHRADG